MLETPDNVKIIRSLRRIHMLLRQSAQQQDKFTRLIRLERIKIERAQRRSHASA